MKRKPVSPVFPIEGGMGEWPSFIGRCARIERCGNSWYGGSDVEIRLMHNKPRTKWWYGAECCPKKPQPTHSAQLTKPYLELLIAMKWKAEVFFILTSKDEEPNPTPQLSLPLEGAA